MVGGERHQGIGRHGAVLGASDRSRQSAVKGLWIPGEQMEQFGATEGKAVYASVLAAAERGVPIRILQHKGFSPSFDVESAAMAAGRPNVQKRTLLLIDWWGSGIVHSKLWMANREDAYLGSANNDWKSLTQITATN